jgi:intein/homing endonuclease
MFYSFLAKGTLITLSDGTTKAVEELVKDDKVLTYNYSAKNHDGAHLENNELRIGTIANLIKYLIPRKDTVKVTLSNGNEIVVTKDFPLIGAGKAIGWQVYDAIAYKDKEVSFEVLEVGKELYSWPIKVSEYEHITSLEEQTGEDLEEMYCINKVMIGHTIFANGFLVSACDWGYVWPDEFYIMEGNHYPRGEGQ